MEDNAEIHFLKKKEAPISISGDWGFGMSRIRGVYRYYNP